jgi:hypothetical protein
MNEIETAISLLDEKTKQEHDKCIKEGLKDEFCPKCNRLFLAHIHFIACDNDQCPMSNGKTFFDMLLELEENSEKNTIYK